MDARRVNFGKHLKEEREARALTIAEVARVTKIPERSLDRLETGQWDELPAEVFVRGFVRSYARCVGLDPEESARRYAELLVVAEKPRRELSLSRLGLPRHDPERTEVQAERAESSMEARGEAKIGGTSAAPRRRSTTEEISAIAQAMSDVGRSTGRVPLTLAVIILVIVATLTLSLLLRRPSHVGDGVSWSTPPCGLAVSVPDRPST
jgi:hypothetical protein